MRGKVQAVRVLLEAMIVIIEALKKRLWSTGHESA
jgi:hypothetical protein